MRLWTYDENGLVLIKEYRSKSGGVWRGSRYTYTYDEDGNCLTKLTETFQDGTWINYQLVTNTYTGGQQASLLSQYWVKAPDNYWRNVYRYLWEYNGDGNCTARYYQNWKYVAPDYLNGYWNNYSGGNMNTCWG